MKKYKFLIVTPSYNQGVYIKETIESVLHQQEAVEYVVMDGGSTDTTSSILKEYNKKLTWFSEKDKGQTDAINKGITYFKDTHTSDKDTEYIFAYMNSDDYYLPEVFSKVAAAFDANPHKHWLVGEYQVDAHKNQFFHTLISSIWKKILKLLYSYNLLLIANPIAQPATFIRWTAVKKVGNFNQNLRYVMDYEYWLRLQKQFGSPIFLDTVLASFRIHEVSKGGAQFKKQFLEQYQIAKSNTDNPLILNLHKLHNWLTITLYSIMK